MGFEHTSRYQRQEMYIEPSHKNQPNLGYQALDEEELLELEETLRISENGTKLAAQNGTPEKGDLALFLQRVHELNGEGDAHRPAHNLLPTYITNTPHNTPSHTQTSITQNGRAAPKPRRTRGPGKLTAEEERYKRAVEGMNDIPHTMEFSLNFSFRQEGSFLSVPDPVNIFERRLHKYMRKFGIADTPFAFAFDVDREQNRLHAHGVIQVKPELQEAVKLALRHAGGFIKGPSGSRQVKLKRIPDRRPEGWQAYTVMYRKRVEKLFEEHGVEVVRTCNVSTAYRRLLK